MALTNYKHKDLKSSYAVPRTLGNTLWEVSFWNVSSVQTGCSVVLPLLPIKHELGFWVTAVVHTPLSESPLSKTALWFSLECVHSGTDQPGTYSISQAWQVYRHRWVETQFNLKWVTQCALAGWAPDKERHSLWKGWCICVSEGLCELTFSP